MTNIRHIKQILIWQVFTRFYITLCLLVLSSNCMQKQCDSTPSELRRSTYLCPWLIGLISNSDNRILNPLNATCLDLFRTGSLYTVLLRTRWLENRSISYSSLAYFTMATESTNTWSFGAYFLPKTWYVYNVTQFYV